MGPMAITIQKKLVDMFSPLQLEIVNESFKHNVPKGSETHFKVCPQVILYETFIYTAILRF